MGNFKVTENIILQEEEANFLPKSKERLKKKMFLMSVQLHNSS